MRLCMLVTLAMVTITLLVPGFKPHTLTEKQHSGMPAQSLLKVKVPAENFNYLRVNGGFARFGVKYISR